MRIKKKTILEVVECIGYVEQIELKDGLIIKFPPKTKIFLLKDGSVLLFPPNTKQKPKIIKEPRKSLPMFCRSFLGNNRRAK